MQIPKIGYSQNKTYIRYLQPLTTDEIFPLIGKHKHTFWGNPIYMRSDRYFNFLENGTECVCCGVKAYAFYLETSIGKKERRWRDSESQNMTREQRSGLHLNLYALREDGTEVMLTKDHIVPRACGGEDEISNYQTMCVECNRKKGTQSMEEFMKETENTRDFSRGMNRYIC